MKRRAQGIVESDRMEKTITVNVERLQKHPRYKKYVRYNSTFMAHDDNDSAAKGDLVEIEECSPISKNKTWRLVSVKKRAAETASVEM